MESQMIVIVPGAARRARSQRSRRRARCRPSLHNYRRALARRFGIGGSFRPAHMLDAIARELIAARVA
jgi:hypothetical protein